MSLVLLGSGPAGCGGPLRYGPRPVPVPVAEPVAGLVQRGIASYYGPHFDGRRTASGEIFDMRGLTAAHPSLPFGTWVRVTHLGSGRTVVVRINDRGPFVRGRIIDLSYGAAEALGMIAEGVAMVEVRVVPGPTSVAAGTFP